jgi:hypothetical protein
MQGAALLRSSMSRHIGGDEEEEADTDEAG